MRDWRRREGGRKIGKESRTRGEGGKEEMKGKGVEEIEEETCEIDRRTQ